MGQTLVDKIWAQHSVKALGDVTLLAIDRILLHERTGGVALRSLRDSGRSVRGVERVFGIMDHVVDTFPGRTDKTIMPTGADFIRTFREECARAGITLFDIGDPRQGIVHVVSPEQGIVLPGVTLIAPDSHTCTQGALGAMAWGVGSSEAEHALATGVSRVSKPGNMRIRVDGVLGAGVTVKDLALHILAALSAGGGKGCAIEYCGEAIAALDLEARMTLCNMAAELSAFNAIVAPDDKTIAYLKGRPFAPQGALWEQAEEYWRTLTSDEDAVFDRDIRIDAADVAPMVTWGASPQQASPINARVPAYEEVAQRESRESYQRGLDYMALEAGAPLEGLAIDAAFIGSCTNSRISDLRAAAAVLKGRKVAAGVKAICVPGSSQVKLQAEAEGIDKVFADAGFEWRESGCSMCFFAGGESFAPKARVVSSTNRNFENRQGPGTRTHLASPAVVAASAIAGAIADPRKLKAS